MSQMREPMLVGSLAVAIYGRLTPRSTNELDADADCFSAFVALTSVLGWLSGPAEGQGARGLWGMNDADGPWFGDDRDGMRALFQVGLNDVGRSPFPVEALVSAAVSTVERFGDLDLSGLELYVPVPRAGPATRHLLAGQDWFDLAAPQARARLRITIDSGPSSAVIENADRLLDTLRAVAPSEEGLDAEAVADESHVDFPSPAPWRWWLGEGPGHLLTLTATATEWSPLGIGRVLTSVVEACRLSEIQTPLGLRVAHEGASDAGLARH